MCVLCSVGKILTASVLASMASWKKTDKWVNSNYFDQGCDVQQNLPPGGDEDVSDLM